MAENHQDRDLPLRGANRPLGQFGLDLTPGGVTQAVARAARRASPTYQALLKGVRASPVVASNEAGWRVGGRRAWLWAFAGQGVVVYRVAPGRGHDDAVAVLGHDYAGVLERDGWVRSNAAVLLLVTALLCGVMQRVPRLGRAERRVKR